MIQVCSDPTPTLCNTSFGRMTYTLPSAALQYRPTACLWHCSYTYGGLLLIQVCSDPTPMLCNTGSGRMPYTLTSAALQTRPTACMWHCSYTYEVLLLIQVCRGPTPMLCNTGFGRMTYTLTSAALQTGPQHACVTAITPMEVCCSYKCAVTQHQCSATLVLAECPTH